MYQEDSEKDKLVNQKYSLTIDAALDSHRPAVCVA